MPSMRWMPSLASALALALALLPAPADARAKKKKPADDGAFALELEAGIFFANLDSGLTNLSIGFDETAVDRAIDSVGSGAGNVGQLRGRLSILGYDVLFGFVSDEIVDLAARPAVEDEMGNTIAQEALLYLLGELRPDLRGLLADDDRPYVKVEFGRFEGIIEQPWRFATRDGRPWFPSREGARWQTDLLTVEAGTLVVEPDRRREDDSATFGAFLRYTAFERPVVIGFGDDDGRGFALQNGALGLIGAGFRGGYTTCDGYCIGLMGDMIPFTGWTWLDLGPFGSQRGVVLAGSAEIRLSWPIDFGDAFAIEPYASFRLDYLLPILGTYFDAEIDNAQLWAPDYVLWGPTVGLALEI